ncbi:hypothetical protein [Sulfobacillus thermosulfidooxidans]|uniref:hypothetical protein n=1 Tax=Sulfobacillus thermosulfidooxidans TaxID=28034 RepID=UPI0003710FF5|nr:hypothetical protein [Sulfobacillus thermosulfidooxidans]
MSDMVMFPLKGAGGTANAPTNIGSAPYTNFAANSTYDLIVVGALHREARERSFVITNTLNEAITSVTFWLFDSTLDTYSNTAGGMNYVDSGGIASNGYGQYTSEQAGILAAHFDSVIVTLGMGSTAPTSGEVVVSVVEYFD